jgi:hypothetical protein
MDLSIRPEPHEDAILQNIRSYRESEMRGFFTSDLLKSTVASKGGQFALELIGDHLADYPHIMAEIVGFIDHRMS